MSDDIEALSYDDSDDGFCKRHPPFVAVVENESHMSDSDECSSPLDLPQNMLHTPASRLQNDEKNLPQFRRLCSDESVASNSNAVLAQGAGIGVTPAGN